MRKIISCSFLAPLLYPGGAYAAIEDFDGDQRLDIAFVHAGGVGLLRNQGCLP